MANRNQRLLPVPVPIREMVQEALRSSGPAEVARQLGVGRHVVLAAAAEVALSPGSLALLREAHARRVVA